MGRSGVDSALRQHFHQCTQVMYFLMGSSHFAIFTSTIISDLCLGTERNRVVLYCIYNLEFKCGLISIQGNGLLLISAKTLVPKQTGRFLRVSIFHKY